MIEEIAVSIARRTPVSSYNALHLSINETPLTVDG
jgi:hypothetical protein